MPAQKTTYVAPETNSAPVIDLANATPEMLTKLRDPFQKPALKELGDGPKSELERYPVEQYELLGVVTGPLKMRAMVRSPDSKTHVVSERMKMGVHSGIVRKITAGSVVVREKTLNIFGQEEEVDTEIKLVNKSPGSAGS